MKSSEKQCKRTNFLKFIKYDKKTSHKNNENVVEAAKSYKSYKSCKLYLIKMMMSMIVLYKKNVTFEIKWLRANEGSRYRHGMTEAFKLASRYKYNWRKDCIIISV